MRKELLTELLVVARLHTPLRTFFQCLKFTTIAVVAAVVCLVLIQLGFPRNRTTPLLRVHGMTAGNTDQRSLAQTVSKLDEQHVRIQTTQKVYEGSFRGIGITVDSDTTARKLLDYSLLERLTPFSLFRRTHKADLALQRDIGKIEEAAKKIAEATANAPQNAKVHKTNEGFAVAAPSSNGSTYLPEEITEQLKNITLEPDTTVVLPPTSQTTPAIKTEQLEAVVAQANSQIAKPIQLEAGGKSISIGTDVLREVITINIDEAQGAVGIAYDRELLKKQTATLANQLYSPGVAAQITLRDGVEAARVAGKNGQFVSVDEGADAVIAALQQNKNQAKVAVRSTTPKPTYTRGYSPTSAGLQALINDWQKETGLQVGIVVRELTGTGRSASINANTSFNAASLYKLYLAQYIYQRVQDGSLQSTAPVLGTSRNIGSCLEVIITLSENTCAESLANMVGWNTLTAFAQQNGYGGTKFSGGVFTSASDTATFLQRLQGGSLLSPSNSQLLLTHMKQQIYRQAIAKGSQGVVANKVGFINGSWRDAGIVHHPKSTYILVVITQGGNAQHIAELAARISNFMNQ